MKIVQIINQNRRDFTATIICEGCGNEERLSSGYDDRNYHDCVVPAIKCSRCGESRNSLGIKGERVQTKYAEWEMV